MTPSSSLLTTGAAYGASALGQVQWANHLFLQTYAGMVHFFSLQMGALRLTVPCSSHPSTFPDSISSCHDLAGSPWVGPYSLWGEQNELSGPFQP